MIDLAVIRRVFIEEAAERILARRPKREKNPPLILIGGANCMGDMGAALEYVEAYDYVFRSEADEIAYRCVPRRLTIMSSTARIS